MSGVKILALAAMLLGSLPAAGDRAAGDPGTPGAFELLSRVRQAYAAVDSYQDHGVLERTALAGGRPTGTERFHFSIAVDRQGAAFLFRLVAQDGSEQVFWQGDGKASRYDSRGGRSWEVRSLAGELLPFLGEGSQDVLVVASLLLGQESALPEPVAAAVEGPEACGGHQCWILRCSLAGGLETVLQVETGSWLIRRVEVRVEEGASLFLPGAGGADETVLVAEHSPELGGGSVTAIFEPPPASEGPGPGAEDPRPDATFRETLTVALSTYRVRALEQDGSPVLGLRPEDFRVRVGRKDAPVVAVDWMAAGQSYGSDLPPEVLAQTGLTVAPPGQLLVFFVQAGLHSSRMRGQLRQVPRARDLLGTLGRDDRVAVVSFDSHLKLRLDFTRDFHAVEEALADSIRFGKLPPLLKAGRYPSLARSFDAAAAKKIATAEAALEFTANALYPLLGDKTMVFIGWGLGDYTDGGVRYGLDYDRARAALAAARTSVFVLDISEADYHTLELGLQQIARDTGGTYERVFRRGTIATRRLARTLSGYYLVSFEREVSGKEKEKSVRITLRDRRGELIVSSWNADP